MRPESWMTRRTMPHKVGLAPCSVARASVAKAFRSSAATTISLLLLLVLAARTPAVSATVKYCEDGWTHQDFQYPVSGGADPDYGSVADRKYGSHCYKAVKLNTEGEQSEGRARERPC